MLRASFGFLLFIMSMNRLILSRKESVGAQSASSGYLLMSFSASVSMADLTVFPKNCKIPDNYLHRTYTQNNTSIIIKLTWKAILTFILSSLSSFKWFAENFFAVILSPICSLSSFKIVAQCSSFTTPSGV
jgi:hypothetical protein